MKINHELDLPKVEIETEETLEKQLNQMQNVYHLDVAKVKTEAE